MLRTFELWPKITFHDRVLLLSTWMDFSVFLLAAIAVFTKPLLAMLTCITLRWSTLLGKPAHLLIHGVILSANHVSGVPMIASDSCSCLTGVESNMVSAVVAHTPQRLMVCACRDVFLLPTVVNSSPIRKAFSPAELLLTQGFFGGFFCSCTILCKL